MAVRGVNAAADLIPDWLRRRAVLNADHPAITNGASSWTFAALDARVDASVAVLSDAGVTASDRVALLAGNSAAFAQTAFAVTRLGGVLVPLNLRLTAAEIGWQLADCGASCVITDRPDVIAAIGEAPRVLALADVAVGPLTSPPGDLKVAATLREVSGYEAAVAHSIIYTSGTTGRPKGAVLSHGNFFWSALGSLLQLGAREDDRWLACMPLFHVGGLSILLRGLLNGTTTLVHETFDADAANAAIDDEGVTIVSLVPTMLQRMLDARADRPYPAWLRCVLLGGGPIPPELVERCLRLGVAVAPSYGLTEAASQVTTLRPDEVARKPASAGRPLACTELRVVREDGGDCAPDEAGEIIVRGPTVTTGYWGRPEESATALRGGWLHTGDAATLDADGYLYVLDRRDDVIVSGGENVYPAEVEAVLASHPDVADAGVFALPDATWGQAVAAVVCLRPGAAVDEDRLRAYCRERLAGFKLPKRIYFAETIPRNAAGKLLRRELRALVGETAPSTA
jgi:O-succinylbenzoic acid--CoA ligase